MRNVFLLVMLLLSGTAYTQSVMADYPESFKVTILNPLTVARENVLVLVSFQELSKNLKKFNPHAFVVMDGEKEIPSQYNQNDVNDLGIVFVLDRLEASETRQLFVRFHPSGNKPRSYPKRTQAELSYKTGGEWKNREYVGGSFQNTQFLRVPPEHKDHSWFIRYEGPGWESDKVGYRFLS